MFSLFGKRLGRLVFAPKRSTLLEGTVHLHGMVVYFRGRPLVFRR